MTPGLSFRCALLATLVLGLLGTLCLASPSRAGDATQWGEYCVTQKPAYTTCISQAAHTYSFNRNQISGYRTCVWLLFSGGAQATDRVCSRDTNYVQFHPNYSTYLYAALRNDDDNPHNMAGYREW